MTAAQSAAQSGTRPAAAEAPLPEVSAVVLAYGPEDLLEECVAALLGSHGVRIEVVLVDNGCTGDTVERLRGVDGVRLVEPGRNTGFTGGCRLGVAAARSDVLALVNSDAVVAPGAVAALVRALDDDGVGVVSGSLRLRSRPGVVNSAGNPVHYLGLSWAGGLGEPAADHARRAPVASATGGLMALRRGTWDTLGGFHDPLFAYCEDVELSLRCWQRGLRVEYVPDAVATHAYEFSRNPAKMYLLERNRLAVVLTVWPARTLLVLAPALLGLEAALLVVALRGGWAGQKVRGWWWLLTRAGALVRRRSEVQAARTAAPGAFHGLLTEAFEPGAETGLRVPRVMTAASRWYWSAARSLMGVPA
ncbi:MAG: glycosyltransferase family 2 protein [Nocardioidaceae bacterium]